jgi:signal transduction histidine kinase
MENVSNAKLLAELAKRLNHNASNNAQQELIKIEEEMRYLGIQLQESEKCKSQFLSNVRNEINNPLSAIIGLASTIWRLSSEEKIRSISTLIEKQAVDLDFQMRNIIVAAEIEAGELKKNFSRVRVSTLVGNQITYLKHRIDQHGVRLDISVPGDFEFYTDGQILQIICLNLFANAIEYCGHNKIVIIQVSQNRGDLELFVSDFGNGIEQTMQSEIFQRFKQGQTGLRKNHYGHGLGLCIVKELTSCLGGTIELQSSPGRGTIAKITLPEMPAEGLTDSLSFGNELLFGDTEML